MTKDMTFMNIYDLYIFEILIHFYPNLVVKNDVIFGKTPVISRHNLKTPSPLADDVICERPLTTKVYV